MSRFTLLFCRIFCYWRNQQSVSESFLRSSSLESSMQYPVPKACFATGFRKSQESKVTETNESTGFVIQLVWMPLRMEILSTCTSVAIKTCKMKQKKAVPCLHPGLMDVPLLLLGRCVLPGKSSRSGASTAGGFISHEQEQNSASEGAVPCLNNQLHHSKHIISWTACNTRFG